MANRRFQNFKRFASCFPLFSPHTRCILAPLLMKTIGVAIVGCGGITLQNHLPGLALCPETRVTALCDADAATLERARQQTGVPVCSANYEEIVKRDDVHAVIIATPNITHGPVARAATSFRTQPRGVA
mgnify:CR=1 FL=1